MLIDGRRIPGNETVSADLCIIGAGAAGITICFELAEAGLQVLLLEAGGRRHDKAVQAFYDGQSLSPHVHAPPSMYRQRRFGGTTTIWGGRCVPLDALDFEYRDWVPHSGWPFQRDAIEDYYRRAMIYLEAGECTFNEHEALRDWREFVEGFSSETVDSDIIERFSAPTDFGKVYGNRLISASNVKVVQNASCIELVQTHQSGTVSHVRCATIAGTQFDVKARCFVISAGGLETTRLLLASDRTNTNGLGNENGLLGRNYMCHIEGSLAAIRLQPKHREVVWSFERTKDGFYTKRRFHIRDEEQRKHRILNTIFRLHHANPADAAHGNPVLSAMYLTKQFLIPEYRRKLAMIEYSYEKQTHSSSAGLLKHMWNLVRGAPALAHFASNWLVDRHLRYHRIPYVALYSANGIYPLDFNAEQLPNPDSRITLSNDRDSLGMRKLVVDWRMDERDVHSIVQSHSILQKAVADSKIGQLEYFESDVEAAAKRSVPVGGHHIGTARMSNDPKAGIVDPYCRMHTVPNVYLAGSAVFPTSGQANPTLTIVALAIRLTDHLKALEGRAEVLANA
jgi:choline dehydrogenase-like flavoprotein